MLPNPKNLVLKKIDYIENTETPNYTIGKALSDEGKTYYHCTASYGGDGYHFSVSFDIFWKGKKDYEIKNGRVTGSYRRYENGSYVNKSVDANFSGVSNSYTEANDSFLTYCDTNDDYGNHRIQFHFAFE